MATTRLPTVDEIQAEIMPRGIFPEQPAWHYWREKALRMHGKLAEWQFGHDDHGFR